MPVTYHIDKAQKTIHTACTGYVDYEEVIDHFRVLAQDPECPDRLNVLLDLTDLATPPNADQLMGVSDAIGRAQDRVQFDACAIVAPKDLLFGVSRVFEVLTEGKFRITRTFRQLNEAEEWLSQNRSAT